MQAQARTPAVVVVNVVAALLVGLYVSGYRFEFFDLLRQLWPISRLSDLLPGLLAVLVCVLAARTRLSRYGWFLSAAGVVGMWVFWYVAYLGPLPVWQAIVGLAGGLMVSGVVGTFAASPPSRVPVVLAFVGGLVVGRLGDTLGGLSYGLVFPTGLTLLLSLAGFLVLRTGPALAPRLDWKDIAGIVDGTTIRTSGYLTGPMDVALTPDEVARYGLRRGDAVTGVARERSRTLVRVDAVNGLAPLVARPEFAKLPAAEPRERLRLDSVAVIARVVDLVMPLGKGQRALLVAPPGAGATTTLRAIGDALPSGCHRMLLLVDQRPEDVAAIRRDTTNAEVIASTVDMHATSHVEMAALALDRARRLVELGHDVVVLLDSVTRLGRAYQAASGRPIMPNPGGLDAAAVSGLRQFLGAARAIEGGGSLTILAVVTVGTGSPIEAAILDELKDTANATLVLRSDSTVDVSASGTRQTLLSPSEEAIAARLRKLLPTMDAATAVDQASSAD
jgi:transcription termination factor Rho